MKRFILPFIISLIISACSAENPDLKSIRINLSENNTELHYENFLESVRTIKLQTDNKSFLPDPKKCLITISASHIFIYNKTSKKVHVYDYQGKPVSIIENSGKGPNEYISPTQLLCNGNGELIIIDFARKAVLFDKSWTPSKEIKFDCRYSSVIRKDGYYYGIKMSPDEETKVSIVKMDTDFKLIDQISVDSLCPDIKTHSFIRLSKSKNGLIFQPYPIIDLFHIDEKFELKHFIKLDLGENSVKHNDDMIGDIQLLNTKSWLMNVKFIGDYLFVIGAEKGPKAKALNINTQENYNISRSRYNGSYSIKSSDQNQSFDLVGGGIKEAYGIIAPSEGSNDNFYIQIAEIKDH